MRKCRLRYGQCFQYPAGAQFAAGQDIKDSQPGRFAQCLEYGSFTFVVHPSHPAHHPHAQRFAAHAASVFRSFGFTCPGANHPCRSILFHSSMCVNIYIHLCLDMPAEARPLSSLCAPISSRGGSRRFSKNGNEVILRAKSQLRRNFRDGRRCMDKKPFRLPDLLPRYKG